jgi:hypothetical protein
MGWRSERWSAPRGGAWRLLGGNGGGSGPTLRLRSWWGEGVAAGRLTLSKSAAGSASLLDQPAAPSPHRGT